MKSRTRPSFSEDSSTTALFMFSAPKTKAISKAEREVRQQKLQARRPAKKAQGGEQPAAKAFVLGTVFLAQGVLQRQKMNIKVALN